MAAARALFAFQRGDVDEDGEPTDDALTGALLWAEHHAHLREYVNAHRKK